MAGGFVKQGALNAMCTRMQDSLRVKTPTLDETIGNLSGGNQQKALIARCLMTNPRILILDEPTRGIDVGAKAEIHQLISDLAAEGMAIIMISSEMPEILGMSDRIMVMHEGHVSGFLDRERGDAGKDHGRWPRAECAARPSEDIIHRLDGLAAMCEM